MYVHAPFPNTVYALDLNDGKENVMPASGENKNVYRNLDDISVYLRARAVGDAPRGCPPKKADRPQGRKTTRPTVWVGDMARAAANTMRNER
jgi:hypothetical protein